MLSVIIPTFNSERTIKRLLDSFYVRPISTEYEIIIVDGCSTDSTIKICSEYNVKIINNPKIHAASARNIGVANSQGDIVAFIDSDCIACPMWIDKIYQVFTKKTEEFATLHEEFIKNKDKLKDKKSSPL